MQHACESLGDKPVGAMKVKAGVGLLRRELPPGAHRRPIPGYAVAGFE